MRRPLVLFVLVEGLIIALLAMLLVSGSEQDGQEDRETVREGPRPTATTPGATEADPSRNLTPVEATDRSELPPSTSDPVGILVHGNVSEADGTPVGEGIVSFSSPRIEGRRFTGVDRPGAYAVSGLSPGEWTLSYRANTSGYRELHRPVTIPEGVRTYRLNVVVQRAVVLQVRFLTPEGGSITELMDAGARQDAGPSPFDLYALATSVPPPGHFPASLANGVPGSGRWTARRSSRDELPAGVDGMLQLEIDPPVYASAMLRHLVLATELVQPGQEQVALHIPLAEMDGMLATVRLRVVDAESRVPVQGGRIAIVNGSARHSPQAEDGTATFERIVPGIAVLQVQAEGYEYLWKHVWIEAGEQDLGDVELATARTLRGTVVDAEGRPVQARIQWDNLDQRDFPQPLFRNRSWRSDAEGKFAIERFGSGRHVVHAIHPDKGRASVLVDTSATPVPEVRLQLAPTHEVTLEPGFGPFEVYTVTISTRDGLPVVANRLQAGPSFGIRLPAGGYRVDIHSDLALVRRQSLTVGDGPVKVVIP